MPGADRDDVDEDDAVVDRISELAPSHAGLLLILVPRRPERFDEAETRLREAGVRYIRRSADDLPRDLTLPCVVLLDSIGELASLFPIADVVFMGGTLARRGGHNVLEPAASRKAIVTGPHLENGIRTTGGQGIQPHPGLRGSRRRPRDPRLRLPEGRARRLRLSARKRPRRREMGTLHFSRFRAVGRDACAQEPNGYHPARPRR